MTLDQKKLMAEFTRRLFGLANEMQVPLACFTVTLLLEDPASAAKAGDHQLMTFAAIAGAFQAGPVVDRLVKEAGEAIRIAETAVAESKGSGDPGKSN